MNLYCTGHFPAPQKNTYKVKKERAFSYSRVISMTFMGTLIVRTMENPF